MSMFQIITQEGWTDEVVEILRTTNDSMVPFVAIYFVGYHLFVTLVIFCFLFKKHGLFLKFKTISSTQLSFMIKLIDLFENTNKYITSESCILIFF